MNPIKLTIQIFHQGAWHDAAELTLQQPQLGRSGPARLGYDFDYALEWLQRDDEHACSLVLPIEFESILNMPAMGFDYLDDKLKRWELL